RPARPGAAAVAAPSSRSPGQPARSESGSRGAGTDRNLPRCAHLRGGRGIPACTLAQPRAPASQRGAGAGRLSESSADQPGEQISGNEAGRAGVSRALYCCEADADCLSAAVRQKGPWGGTPTRVRRRRVGRDVAEMAASRSERGFRGASPLPRAAFLCYKPTETLKQQMMKRPLSIVFSAVLSVLFASAGFAAQTELNVAKLKLASANALVLDADSDQPLYAKGADAVTP